MQNGYYQATAGMVTQFNRLNVISNNLANVNTIGYKRNDVVIGDFARIFKETQDELPLKNHTKDGAKFLNRTLDRVPQVSEEYTDFSAGGFKYSSNTLDFAIKRDDAFFLVDTPNGVKLSKNGSFSLDGDGYIVTKEGYRVLPSGYEAQNPGQRGIQVPQGEVLTVDKNGNLYSNNNQFSKFYIAQPREIRDLKKVGDNLFETRNFDDITEIDEADSVMQGYAQMSNVNPVLEMVGLIETQRLVDMYQKVMTSHMTDLNQDAVQAQNPGQRGIQVPQGEVLTVDKNGNLYSNNNQFSKFYIAQPREIRDLKKVGDNLFETRNFDDITEIDEADSVMQGYAQMSNVNPVLEMVGLIETQRLVDMYQKVMTSHMTDLNQDAVQKLALKA